MGVAVKRIDARLAQVRMLGNGSLSLARSRLLSPRVFVGLTEHSELSYCLLEHWLGVFDKSRCADTHMMEEM